MGPERSSNKAESFTIVKRILFLLLLLVSFIPLYTSSKYLYLHPTTTTTAITQTTGLHQSLASFQTTKNHKNNNNENNDLYSLAKAQSFGFFDDISTSHWNRLHQIFVEHENHRHPDKPFTAHADATREEFDPEVWKQREQISQQWKSVFMSDTAWYQNNYEPNFSCQFEKRVGIPMNGDGPKWICDPHRIARLAAERKASNPDHPGCVIYSVGSNGDFTFELGMQREVGEGTCEYHIFDMGDYKSLMPPELKRAHYHRWGFVKQGSTKPMVMQHKKENNNIFKGFKDTIKELGHDNLDVIDIFKIDCEHCEWETYQDWLADDIPMLHQILVEVHTAPKNTVLDFFDSLEAAGYLRFHKEPNIQFCPSCLEYGFVKVDKAFLEGKKLSLE